MPAVGRAMVPQGILHLEAWITQILAEKMVGHETETMAMENEPRFEWDLLASGGIFHDSP